MRKYSQLFLIVIAFIAGTFVSLLTTVALANGGDANLIHSCVNSSTGAVRIVAVSTTCASGETALNWNAKGLPGTGALVANLNGAQLSNTDFSWRTLKGDDFSGSGCTFNSDIFNHTDLNGTNFTDCSFGNYNSSATTFNNTDFTTFTLGNNTFNNPSITNSNLSGLNMTTDNFQAITITSSNLTGVNLSNIELGQNGGITISSTNLTNANLSGISFGGQGVDFSNDNYTNTNFTGANFSNTSSTSFAGVTGSNTNFTNANLSNVTTTGADLTSPIWSNTTCPDSTNSNDDGNTCVGHGF